MGIREPKNIRIRKTGFSDFISDFQSRHDIAFAKKLPYSEEFSSSKDRKHSNFKKNVSGLLLG
jgi:hypothetical protein